MRILTCNDGYLTPLLVGCAFCRYRNNFLDSGHCPSDAFGRRLRHFRRVFKTLRSRRGTTCASVCRPHLRLSVRTSGDVTSGRRWLRLGVAGVMMGRRSQLGHAGSRCRLDLHGSGTHLDIVESFYLQSTHSSQVATSQHTLHFCSSTRLDGLSPTRYKNRSFQRLSSQPITHM